MNIFLPYNDIQKSVESLDDKRLNKQILECYQIYFAAIKKGYNHHPVVVHYAKYPFFVIRYGLACCMEYFYRFEKFHVYTQFFGDAFINALQNASEDSWKVPAFYAQYSRKDPRCIRTTENTEKLFQEKLALKWLNDSTTPKWTKRNEPEFLKSFALQKANEAINQFYNQDLIDGELLKEKLDKFFLN